MAAQVCIFTLLPCLLVPSWPATDKFIEWSNCTRIAQSMAACPFWVLYCSAKGRDISILTNPVGFIHQPTGSGCDWGITHLVSLGYGSAFSQASWDYPSPKCRFQDRMTSNKRQLQLTKMFRWACNIAGIGHTENMVPCCYLLWSRKMHWQWLNRAKSMVAANHHVWFYGMWKPKMARDCQWLLQSGK